MPDIPSVISSRTAKASCAWTTGWCCCPTTVILWTGRCFRLYYTSECEDQQSIDIYFEDNSEPAQLFQLTFDFNNETEDEDTVVTSGGKELPVVIVSQ